jgi:hypothetical protein
LIHRWHQQFIGTELPHNKQKRIVVHKSDKVWVSGKNIAAGRLCTSERELSERRTHCQEIEVNTMEEGEIGDVAGEEVVVEEGLCRSKEEGCRRNRF